MENNNNFLFEKDDMKLENKLGGGGFADVYKIRD